MKRGLSPERIALAVASIVAIMTIFAAVLILSGRTVLISGKAVTQDLPYYMNPLGPSTNFAYYQLPMVSEDSPCSFLNCYMGKTPVFIGQENEHNLCVCATIRNGEAYYNEWEVKRIRSERKY